MGENERFIRGIHTSSKVMYKSPKVIFPEVELKQKSFENTNYDTSEEHGLIGQKFLEYTIENYLLNTRP